MLNYFVKPEYHISSLRLFIRQNIYRLSIRCLHRRIICMTWCRAAIVSIGFFFNQSLSKNLNLNITFLRRSYKKGQVVGPYPPSMSLPLFIILANSHLLTFHNTSYSEIMLVPSNFRLSFSLCYIYTLLIYRYGLLR